MSRQKFSRSKFFQYKTSKKVSTPKTKVNEIIHEEIVKEESDKESQMYSSLKESVACPTRILQVLKKQTDLDDVSIHVRYMKFKQAYPNGIIGRKQMSEICDSNQSSQQLIELIFDLYGRNKKSWGQRFIGFREVVLATENISKLRKPESILRWMFRIFDVEAKDEIETSELPDMVLQLLRLSTEEIGGLDDLVKEIVAHFQYPPSKRIVSEEEFVFDGLHNEILFDILLNASVLTSGSEVKSNEHAT